MDNGELSLEQIEKIAEFQEITGVENMEAATEELNQYEWNVERAVQNYLHMRDSSANERASPRNIPVIESVSFIRRIYSWVFNLLMAPVKMTVASIFSLYRLIVQPQRLTDPANDVRQFITLYEQEYGNVHPLFNEGSYMQALNLAKADLKFMLVYLHSQEHQSTFSFCADTLSNPEVIQYVNNNMIVWGCSVSSGEGYKVSQALRENSYPFMAIIALRDNRMTVVSRLEGSCTPERLLTWIRNIMAQNESSLISARAERQERELTATLRQEQDVAYEESLRADQEKERRRREELEREREEQEAERAAQRRQEEDKETRKRMKLQCAEKLPPEPEYDGPNVLHIVAKLPQGQRLERKFREDESMLSLYTYIFCHHESPDRFEVLTNFPRKVIPCAPTSTSQDPPTFKEYGLAKKCMVFVTDLDA